MDWRWRIRSEWVLVLSTVVLCCPAFWWLVRRWIDGQYLAGALALGAVLVWLWRHRCELIGARAGEPGVRRGWIAVAGVGLVLGGGLLAWIANVVESSVVLGWSCSVILAGCLLQVRPCASTLRLLPVTAYSLLVFPLPGLVSQCLSLPIRLLAARGAALLLNAVGIECLATGIMIETVRYRNTVVPACGGEEVVHLFLVLGLALAYALQNGRLGVRFWLHVLSIVPATLFANAMRIAILTYIGHGWGEAAAAGFFHEFSGLVVFAVFLVAMIALGEALRQRATAQAAVPVGAAAAAPVAGQPNLTSGVRRNLVLGCELAVVWLAILYGGWLTQRATTSLWGRELVRLIPSELSGWSWQGLVLTLSEESYLSRNYVIKRLYRRDESEVILFVTTGAEGRRQAYHSPEICYRGDGWEILTAGTPQAPAPGGPGGRPLHYALLRARKGGDWATTVFWLDNGKERTATLIVKDLGEILSRLRHPFRRHDLWALIAITSMNPDPAQAERECLALARALP